MNRRILLASIALAPLVACATGATPAQFQALANAGQSIATQVGAALPGILPLLSAGDQANVKAAYAALQQAAASFAVASSLTSGSTVSAVQEVETTLNTIVGVAASIPAIPEPYHSGLVAAALALPILESMVGLVVLPNTAVAATIAAQKVSAPAPK